MLVYLPANLANLLKNTAHESRVTKWGATTGVRIISQGGIWRCDVTDGRRLITVQGPNEDKEWPNMQEIPDWEGETVVPAEDWQQLFRLATAQLKGLHVPLMQGVAIGTIPADPAKGIVGTQLLLATYKTVTQAFPVEGRFPNTDMVWDNTKPVKLAIRVDPDYIIEVLQSLKALMGDDDVGVTLLYRSANEMLGIQAQNRNTGQVADAVVLPLTFKDARPAVAYTRPDPAAIEDHSQDDTVTETEKDEIDLMIEQYDEAKERHPDMVLIFRGSEGWCYLCGDEVELIQIADLPASVSDDDTFAEFPTDKLETVLEKLVKLGRRVAICDVTTSDGGQPVTAAQLTSSAD